MVNPWRGEKVLPGQRISVVGTTGSGKTTLARTLAKQLHIRNIELDSLYWEANWGEATLDVFRARVETALQGDEWVVDGNYSKARDIVLGRADTVVWLDYALPVMLLRLTRRTFRRILWRENLWNSGNRETWRGAFLGRDSLFWWQPTTYRKRRCEYPAILSSPEYAHLTRVRLTSPGAARRWLGGWNFELVVCGE